VDDFCMKRRLSGGTTELNAVVRRYLAVIAGLPQVRTVAVDSSGSEAEIWTLIEAAPEAIAARTAVYAAELRAVEDAPEISVAFNVINALDFPESSAGDLLPRTATVCLTK
jgi:hypothetical protein